MNKLSAYILSAAVLLFNAAVTAAAESSAAPFSAAAEQTGSSPFCGSWTGKLATARTELTIVFNFSEAPDGSLKATMDSPDQGAEGIEAEVDESAYPAIKLSVPSLYVSYSGLLFRESIVGTFSQAGQSFPLTLTKGTEVLKRPQTPEPPYPYLTEEVSFVNEAAGAVLAGTLSLPEGYESGNAGKPVAVVMVSGSGQQNRDEEIFGHRPFLVIADFLARNGVASLRYDDRGTGASEGGDVENATTEDFMEDALAAVEFLRSSGRFSKIGVLGHSEGGSIAFMLGARGAVDFVISLAGPGVRGDRALTAQVNRIMELSGQPGMVSEEMYRQNARLEGNPWLNWFIDYDPSEDISSIHCPVMALNGSKDCQVISSLNLAAIQAALPRNERNFIKEYDSLNHLFQHCTTGVPTEYRSIGETISPEVLSDIAAWIDRNFTE